MVIITVSNIFDLNVTDKHFLVVLVKIIVINLQVMCKKRSLPNLKFE